MRCFEKKNEKVAFTYVEWLIQCDVVAILLLRDEEALHNMAHTKLNNNFSHKLIAYVVIEHAHQRAHIAIPK